MSTVERAFLLIISSGIVRDVYQRFLRPTAPEKEIEWASYVATVGVGLLVATLALRPPEFLQLIVIFAKAAGLAASFLMPALLGAFWRRANSAGAIAAMVAGGGVTLVLLRAFGSYLG